MSDTRTAAPPSRAAGTTLIAAGAIYFLAEFIAAAAWTDPPYSYTYHFISDLGVRGPATAFGQFMYSPLAWVMNTGFFLFGLTVLAGVLLLKGLPGRRRWPLIVSGVLLAVGGVLVALFPGSGDESTADLHGLGALAAFTGGNALAILLGRAHRFLGVPARLGRRLAALGAVGLAFLVAFLAVVSSEAGNLIGFFERGVLYPFLIGFIALGAALRRRRSEAWPGRPSGSPG